VSIPLFRQHLFVSPELQYTSPRLTMGDTKTNDPVTVNLTIFSRDLGVKGLEASASVYNLFNVHAQDVAGPEFAQQPNLPPLQTIRQDGTNFRFKLSYRF
jgi:outer membrane receptor protein involved in Fe transport